MADLRQQLRRILHGRVCLVGVGNVDLGDDGFGVRLAEAVAKSEVRSANCERSPKPQIRKRGPAVLPLPAGEGRAEGEQRHPRPGGTGSRHRPQRHFGFRICFGLRPSALGLEVLVAGLSPERYVSQLADGAFDTVLFLDAVEFGAAPGSVTLLDAAQITTRYPQVSTHKLSLGLLARLLEGRGRTRVWLLGVQPASLRPGAGLSPAVSTTLGCLASLLESQLSDLRSEPSDLGLRPSDFGPAPC